MEGCDVGDSAAQAPLATRRLAVAETPPGNRLSVKVTLGSAPAGHRGGGGKPRGCETPGRNSCL